MEVGTVPLPEMGRRTREPGRWTDYTMPAMTPPPAAIPTVLPTAERTPTLHPTALCPTRSLARQRAWGPLPVATGAITRVVGVYGGIESVEVNPFMDVFMALFRGCG